MVYEIIPIYLGSIIPYITQPTRVFSLLICVWSRKKTSFPETTGKRRFHRLSCFSSFGGCFFRQDVGLKASAGSKNPMSNQKGCLKENPALIHLKPPKKRKSFCSGRKLDFLWHHEEWWKKSILLP